MVAALIPSPPIVVAALPIIITHMGIVAGWSCESSRLRQRADVLIEVDLSLGELVEVCKDLGVSDGGLIPAAVLALHLHGSDPRQLIPLLALRKPLYDLHHPLYRMSIVAILGRLLSAVIQSRHDRLLILLARGDGVGEVHIQPEAGHNI